jgi:hypothetical protein
MNMSVLPIFSHISQQREALKLFTAGCVNRGGYYPSILEPGADIKAEIFHMIYTCHDLFEYLVPQTKIPDVLGRVFMPLAVLAQMTANRMSITPSEICIRTIWYPAQPRTYSLTTHLDACYLTIPFYDSTGDVQTPFYGQMAEIYADNCGRYHKPLRHRFKACADQERMYVVAFVQQKQKTYAQDEQYKQHVRDALTLQSGGTYTSKI